MEHISFWAKLMILIYCARNLNSIKKTDAILVPIETAGLAYGGGSRSLGDN